MYAAKALAAMIVSAPVGRSHMDQFTIIFVQRCSRDIAQFGRMADDQVEHWLRITR